MKLACFAGSMEPATVEVTSKRAPLTPSISSVKTAFCLFLCIFNFARLNGVSFRCNFLRPDAMDARQADYSRCALAIGSEGRGLSREVLDLCDKTVLIPMSPRCESLNAAIAAAVLLWESWR